MSTNQIAVVISLVPRPSINYAEGRPGIDCMRMRELSAKSAKSEYVRILWACTFTDNLRQSIRKNK